MLMMYVFTLTHQLIFSATLIPFIHLLQLVDFLSPQTRAEYSQPSPLHCCLSYLLVSASFLCAGSTSTSVHRFPFLAQLRVSGVIPSSRISCIGYGSASLLSGCLLTTLAIVPYYFRVIRNALDQRPRLPPLRPSAVRSTGKSAQYFGAWILMFPRKTLYPVDVISWPSTLDITHPRSLLHSYSKSDLHAMQKQLALEAIDSVYVPHHLYTDGSLQSDGRAGCAVFSPDTVLPPGGWVGHRLPVSSSSTFCELYGIFSAVSLLCQRGLSGVVICVSKPALQALSCVNSKCRPVVQRILSFLALVCGRGLVVKFLWIPSLDGIRYSDMVDNIAKAACSLPPSDAGPSPSVSCSLSKVRAATFLPSSHLMDCQRAVCVSIQHYDAFRHHRYKYRRRGLMIRRHNVVSARLRLGYRPFWQGAGVEDEPHFSCPLCHSPNASTLEHYCLSCPEVRDMLPRGQPLLDICRHLLVHDNLEALLPRYPSSFGPSLEAAANFKRVMSLPGSHPRLPCWFQCCDHPPPNAPPP
ncbi:hypothetical protein GWK47_017388 [Chionoecetes opilio]|uniref:RNase H type-1 domain-containing protein n=1 Tax=Chionoecetes opilio TaxID=41210 RepID=A0A8J5CM36_CHIOP|nr:hypothetical protein GWK47_017388 [Chionoecetes opilio]